MGCEMIDYFYNITNQIMQLQIFVNEKPIYLTNTLSEDQIILSKQDNVLFLHNEKINGTKLLQQLDYQNCIAAIILGNNFTAIKKDFFAQFEVIEAAGGIVQNENKELLFIFRRQKWDLPKGKLEKGETIETCAAREIEEETGVNNLVLKRKIGETYHIYNEKGKDILKVSHWFYFTCPASQKIAPQIEEDIAAVKWIATQNIKEPMANTFKNIKEIMTIFFDMP
jgi:ADP-ribose pyrophosphatase YjhB (NUDIX family)